MHIARLLAASLTRLRTALPPPAPASRYRLAAAAAVISMGSLAGLDYATRYAQPCAALFRSRRNRGAAAGHGRRAVHRAAVPRMARQLPGPWPPTDLAVLKQVAQARRGYLDELDRRDAAGSAAGSTPAPARPSILPYVRGDRSTTSPGEATA